MLVTRSPGVHRAVETKRDGISRKTINAEIPPAPPMLRAVEHEKANPVTLH
jgi:hypothetical protein